MPTWDEVNGRWVWEDDEPVNIAPAQQRLQDDFVRMQRIVLEQARVNRPRLNLNNVAEVAPVPPPAPEPVREFVATRHARNAAFWTVEHRHYEARDAEDAIRQHRDYLRRHEEAIRQEQEAIDRANRDMIEKILGYPEAPILASPRWRRVQQPKFRHQLDTTRDFEIRLLNSVIHVGDLPYTVSGVYAHDGDFLLLLQDENDKRFRAMYSSPYIDLRTPEPQYLQLETPGFMVRKPLRQQLQGISRSNTDIKCVGSKHTVRINNTRDIVRALKTPELLKWSPMYSDLMVKARAVPALRLSPKVAFYCDRNGELQAEYKGRHLGEVQDNTITMDEDDFNKPWIKSDIQMVGCEARLQ